MSFWRSRSILQLVLVGLLTVLAPLCIAIFYTIQTLDELSARSTQLSQTVVSVTRITQVFQSDVLDLERRARQYLTLEDDSLLELFEREREQLLQQLAEIGRVLSGASAPDVALITAQDQLLQILAALPTDKSDLSRQLELFTDLATANQDFQRLSQQYVDGQLEQHRLNAQEIKESLFLWVGLLAVVTVTFSLIFIYWVNKPIKQLETEIRQLGSGGPGQEIQISGPREMQTLGSQLEWLRSRLNDLELQKQQFLMHMSHELKTPLASLREGADLLAEGVAGVLDPRQQEIMDIIQENSRELQRLIENLLDYNQVLHPNEVRAEAIDLRRMWRELLQVNHMSIRKKQLVISVEGLVSRWWGDPGKIRTVLDNLLSNAVNYTPVRGNIAIQWREDSGILVVDVANSGKAIPEIESKRIFQPFYQGSTSRSGAIKGSGIGLSVARECARSQGGTLDLVPHSQFPVCFRLQCPYVNEVAA